MLQVIGPAEQMAVPEDSIARQLGMQSAALPVSFSMQQSALLFISVSIINSDAGLQIILATTVRSIYYVQL